MRHLLVALVTGLAVAACGDSSSSIDDPAAFLAELRAAECAHLVDCGVYADADQCERRIGYPGLAFEVWFPLPGEPAWVGHVAAGTMSYDPDRAGACIAAVRTASCNPGQGAAPCWDVFDGIAPEGTITTSQVQCAYGYWTLQDCEGTCCSTGTCGGPIDGGIVLGGGNEGDHCGLTAEGFESCLPQLACRDSACVRLHNGDGCFGNIECPAGSACDDECRPRDQVGDSCSRIVVGEDTCNHIAAHCGDDQRCHAAAVEGESCQGDEVQCRAGLRCDTATGLCAADYSEGEDCSTGITPCAEGLYCGAVAGAGDRCVPLLADGASCDDFYQCASGHCDINLEGGRCSATVTCD